jgi:hypothetical protein
MLSAQTHIHTETPTRYLTQLCKHANSIQHQVLHLGRGSAQDRPQVQHVEWTDTDGTLILTAGRCTLHAGVGALTVRVEAPDEASLRQIQEIVAHDLERFGRRDHLTVN